VEVEEAEGGGGAGLLFRADDIASLCLVKWWVVDLDENAALIGDRGKWWVMMAHRSSIRVFHVPAAVKRDSAESLLPEGSCRATSFIF